MILRPWVVAVFTIAAPVAIWLESIGNPIAYFRVDAPDGQWLYVFSKLTGLAGISVIGVQMALVVAGYFPQSRRTAWKNRHHRLFGGFGVLLILLHMGLFVAAASVRSGHFAAGLLSFRWGNGYYDFMVSVGLLAVCLLVCGISIGIIMYKRKIQHRLRKTHGLAFVVVSLLGLGHSMAIGSETNSIPVVLFYVLIGISTFVALVVVIRAVERTR